MMMSSREIEELQRRFTYHPPKGDQVERYAEIRRLAAELATKIVASCPPSRERDVSLDNLDAVVMFANAAIARNE
jgi:hypothetical protein